MRIFMLPVKESVCMSYSKDATTKCEHKCKLSSGLRACAVFCCFPGHLDRSVPDFHFAHDRWEHNGDFCAAFREQVENGFDKVLNQPSSGWLAHGFFLHTIHVHGNDAWSLDIWNNYVSNRAIHPGRQRKRWYFYERYCWNWQVKHDKRFSTTDFFLGEGA